MSCGYCTQCGLWCNKFDMPCRNNESYKENKMSQWIPCSERLPENRERVLANAKNYFDNFYFDIGFIGIDGKWYDSYGQSMKVIAWMPLPEPYKESSDK